jgi:hypothetical protein
MRRSSRLTATAGVLLSSLLAFCVEPATDTPLADLGSFASPALNAPSSTPTANTAPVSEISSHAAARVFARRWQCQPAISAAVRAGWAIEHLSDLERVLWRESRCTPDAVNKNRNGTTDRGIAQINDVNVGHLVTAGVLDHPSQLFDMHTNVSAALVLHRRDGGFCSWTPPEYCND